MKILVINAGSSSLKYQLFEMPEGKVLAKGLCDCIGIDGGSVTHKRPGQENYKVSVALKDHEEALAWVLKLLTDPELGVIADISEIGAVGHRIAHGGEKLKQSCLIDEKVIKYLYSIVKINPLHGPPAIAGMEGCRKLMPDVPMVGVFDTSFHSTMPDYAYIYPLPYELYTDKSIRRYGFHGTSHRYVANRVAELMGKKIEDLRIITCHLGNGSSITAVDHGKVVDTSMGFTPQEGILMGTRSGSVDPTILTYLLDEGMTAKEVEHMLNKESGFLGVYGKSSDSRVVCDAAAAGDERAQLALRIQYYGIKKCIGAYTAAMNGLDALVFTAGIGENDRDLRREVCRNMDYLGIAIDEELNETLPRGSEADLSAEGARVRTWLIPTDEEYMIALDTARLVG